MAFHIAWSKWRRKHQAIARWCHRQHRMKAEQETTIDPVFAGTATLCNRDRGRSSGTGSCVGPATRPLAQAASYAPRKRNCSVIEVLVKIQLQEITHGDYVCGAHRSRGPVPAVVADQRLLMAKR